MGFEPGQRIGSYRIVRLLGLGGMGAVYEVEHEQLGVHYAMKTFILEEGHVDLFRKRFSAEGKILARLNHPNLVRVIDLDIDEKIGALYFIMDLVLCEDGETHTLADIEPGGADEEQIFEWFRQMCDALAYVHSNGIVHRDIKLNNILLASDRHVVLSDFGISKVSDEKMRSNVDVTKTIVTGMTTGQHLVMGTPGYIAPEIQRGQEATPASDVYSLGVAFFHLLTNVWYDPCLAPNKDGDSLVSMNSVKLLEPFEYRWADVLPRMLDENPANRPLNLAELSALILPEKKEPPKLKRRGWVKWTAALLMITALGGACAWWHLTHKKQPLLLHDLYEIPVATPEK
jgi:serine/threonine protein kinase